MLFMVITTIIAMVINVRRFYLQDNYLLLVVGSILLLLAVWLVAEGIIRFARRPSMVLAGMKTTEEGSGET